MHRKIIAFLSVMVLLLVTESCRVNYSFTGASIPVEAKTISIIHFPNESPLVVPMLSQVITDALRDRFSSQTSLNLVSRDGDLHIEGAITNYITQPVAIQGNEVAALNRLSITIRVKFVNRFNEASNFEQTFTRFSDYPSTQDLTAVQAGLIEEITQALVDDVFNKAVVNW